MPERDRTLACMFLAITGVWSLALGLLGSTEALLFCAPALLLAVPLAFGRYLGEEALAAARARLSSPPRRKSGPATAPPTPAFAPIGLPRGGRLIAASLAKRPPPVSLSHSY